jgi:hypothetical protein
MNQQINLYQPMFRKQEKVFSAVTMVQIIGLVTILLGAIYAYNIWSLRPFEQELVKINVEQQKLQGELKRFEVKAAANTKSQLLEDEIRLLSQELEQKRQVEQVLSTGSYGNRNGFSDYFAGLARQHVSGLWLTNVTLQNGGTQLVLKGKTNNAELIPIYIQKLAKEKAFAGLSFNVLEMSRSETDADIIVFNIATRLGGKDSG